MYTRIAFYADAQFVWNIPVPPVHVHVPGREPVRITSLQLYDQNGAACLEQLFSATQQPIIGMIQVPRPDRAGTVPCHVLGWQESMPRRQGAPDIIQHLAYIVEDGRCFMTPGLLDVSFFQRPRRTLPPHMVPFTWAAVYDHLDSSPALYQVDPRTGIEVSGEHIDRSRLQSLILTDASGDPWIEQIFAPGQQVLYRRRVEQPLADAAPSRIILLGWRRPVHDAQQVPVPVPVQHIAYAFAQTRQVILAGRFDEAHPVFYGLTEVPADRAFVGIPGRAA